MVPSLAGIERKISKKSQQFQRNFYYEMFAVSLQPESKMVPVALIYDKENAKESTQRKTKESLSPRLRRETPA